MWSTATETVAATSTFNLQPENDQITAITDENDASNEVSENTVSGAHVASPPSLTTLILGLDEPYDLVRGTRPAAGWLDDGGHVESGEYVLSVQDEDPSNNYSESMLYSLVRTTDGTEVRPGLTVNANPGLTLTVGLTDDGLYALIRTWAVGSPGHQITTLMRSTGSI